MFWLTRSLFPAAALQKKEVFHFLFNSTVTAKAQELGHNRVIIPVFKPV